jgi:ABC-type uncharacterized transport system YnjBCD ATPase subunit
MSLAKLAPPHDKIRKSPRSMRVLSLALGSKAGPAEGNETLPMPSENEAIPSEALLKNLGLTSKLAVRHLDFYYDGHQALFDNNLDIVLNQVTAIIGPSGCGKSTHIRVYNRIYELYRDQRAEGEVILDGVNILGPEQDVMELRRKVGMIFQKPTPFPMSVFENVAYGLRMHYRLSKSELADRVEEALKRAALWDEVKEVLNRPGTALSGGQQQRKPNTQSSSSLITCSRPPGCRISPPSFLWAGSSSSAPPSKSSPTPAINRPSATSPAASAEPDGFSLAQSPPYYPSPIILEKKN